jgi:hypothetical protein
MPPNARPAAGGRAADELPHGELSTTIAAANGLSPDSAAYRTASPSRPLRTHPAAR